METVRECVTDTDRINWMSEQDGAALVSDDFGNWAVAHDGMQNVPENPGEPSDIETTHFISAEKWKPSIREAIDAARRLSDAAAVQEKD